MRILTGLTAILVMTLMFIPAFAEETYKPSPERLKIEAEIKTMVDACWKETEEHRSSITSQKILDGHWMTWECIKKDIYKFGVPMFEDKEDFEKTFMEPLEKVRKNLGDTLYSLYMDNTKCRTKGCGIGSFQKAIIMSELSHFYAMVLDHVYSTYKVEFDG